MVKILGIVGSHRVNGATEVYVREALKAAEEVVKAEVLPCQLKLK